MRKPVIIITGGDGFLGRYIILRYKEQFDFVVIKREGSKLHHPEIEKYAQIYFNLTDIESSKLNFSHVTGLFMLGASRPELIIEKNIKDINKLEVEEAKSVFDFCIEKNISQIVFASSKSIYGNNDIQPFSEAVDPAPDSLYGMNKLLIEKLGIYFALKYKIKFTALRIAQIFGCGEQKNNMPKIIMENALNNKPLELWKGAENDKRNYIYVKDAANAFIFFLQNKLTGIYNIGMLNSHTPANFVEIILNNTPTKSTIEYKNISNIATRNEFLSVEKAKKIAKWECQWDLQKAIVDFWEESENIQKQHNQI